MTILQEATNESTIGTGCTGQDCWDCDNCGGSATH